jgi:hypothetical protein
MESAEQKYKMLINVNHDNVNYPKGSLCPPQLVKYFVEKGFAAAVEAAPVLEATPAAPGASVGAAEKLAELKAKQDAEKAAADAEEKAKAEAAAKKAK